MRLALAAAAALALALARPGAAIVGGRPAPVGAWPADAFVQASLPDGTAQLCSGALVAPSVVLTAGHCVVDDSTNAILPPSAFLVATGRLDVTDPSSGQVLAVSGVTLFPGFTLGLLRGDVALLQLQAPSTAPPARVAQASDAPWAYAPGTPIWLSGWGLVSPTDPSPPTTLQQVALAAQGDAYCGGTLGAAYDPRTMFCGALPDLAEGACRGDSGGPVMEADPAREWVEVGVISWGGVDCQPPDAFTRLASLQPWLSTTIAGLQATAPQPATPPPVPAPTPAAAAPVSIRPGGPASAPVPPADATPPRVRARATSARPGSLARLGFWVADPSGSVRVRLEVERRGHLLFHDITRWLRTRRGSWWLPWRVPTRVRSSPRLCVAAVDRAGNWSRWSCARVRVRVR